MTEYPLKLAEIVSWYGLKQRSLQGSAVSLVHIREGTGTAKPSAAANFDGVNTMGQISGWVSGEFDLHVLRVSDGKDIFWRHVDVSVVDELEDSYADFLRHLKNPESASAP